MIKFKRSISLKFISILSKLMCLYRSDPFLYYLHMTKTYVYYKFIVARGLLIVRCWNAFYKLFKSLPLNRALIIYRHIIIVGTFRSVSLTYLSSQSKCFMAYRLAFRQKY